MMWHINEIELSNIWSNLDFSQFDGRRYEAHKNFIAIDYHSNHKKKTVCKIVKIGREETRATQMRRT